MRPPSEFSDELGRAERLALERVQKSTDAAWYTRADSWVPFRVQLVLIRVWLCIRGLFT